MENVTDPNALPKFAEFLRDQAKINVITKVQVIEPADPELLNHPIMYMTGHNGFESTDKQVNAVATWLIRGGFLYASACCGRDAANYDLPGDTKPTNDFGTSFRGLLAKIKAAVENLPKDTWPGEKKPTSRSARCRKTTPSAAGPRASSPFARSAIARRSSARCCWLIAPSTTWCWRA